MSGDPLSGVPDNGRYSEAAEYSRGPAGSFRFKGATLEEEARFGGWLPNARPTGPDPMDLFTIGMRGEPGYDDDPVPASDGVGYEHNSD